MLLLRVCKCPLRVNAQELGCCVCIWLHPLSLSCSLQKFMVGLNFADEQEAEHFGNAVETKINERVEKKRANSSMCCLLTSILPFPYFHSHTSIPILPFSHSHTSSLYHILVCYIYCFSIALPFPLSLLLPHLSLSLTAVKAGGGGGLGGGLGGGNLTAEVIGKPPSTVTPINDKNNPFTERKGKPKRPKGKKINKADIGLPSDFRYNYNPLPYTIHLQGPALYLALAEDTPYQCIRHAFYRDNYYEHCSVHLLPSVVTIV